MSDEEFQGFFNELFDKIPAYAKESITNYVKKFIKSEILVSDEAVNMAEQSKKIVAPAALLLATDTHWHFAFRPRILKAPKDVISTIVRHEIAHGFVISVERLPSKEAQGVIRQHKNTLETIRKQAGLQLPDAYDITEDLISIINEDWGSDEDAARKWLASN